MWQERHKIKKKREKECEKEKIKIKRETAVSGGKELELQRASYNAAIFCIQCTTKLPSYITKLAGSYLEATNCATMTPRGKFGAVCNTVYWNDARPAVFLNPR